MIPTASPVIRCPHCRGWIVSRALLPEELPGQAFICSWCARDYEVLGGALVFISRAPDDTVNRESARHDQTARADDRRAVGEVGT